MKWIGQHIWDFISRFRSDVYMEAVESGTIASGGNLGLDANNKVVKAAEVGSSVDLTSEVTGVLPVSSGGTGASTLGDNRILTGTGTSAISAETNLTFDGSSDFSLTSISTNLATRALTVYSDDVSQDPQVDFTNANNNANGAILYLRNTRSNNNGADDDALGTFKFHGRDNGAGDHEFCTIKAEIASATAGSEAGRLKFDVAENDGTLTTGLIIEGQASDDGEVDVTIGAGVESTTTVAGNIRAKGGNFAYANDILEISSSISGKPNITLTNSNTDAVGSQLNFTKTADGANSDELGVLNFIGDDTAGGVHTFAQLVASISNATATDEAGKFTVKVATSDGSGPALRDAFAAAGTATTSLVNTSIGYGALSTTTIAGNLDIDGALITTAGNISLATGGSGDITLDAAGDIDLDTAGGVITGNAASYNFTHAGSGRPSFNIQNNTDDATGPILALINMRDGNGLEDADVLGNIHFTGEDASGNNEIYAKIIGTVVEADNGDEAGQIAIQVANDGTERNGIVITADKGTAEEVDVLIGNGSTSTTTVAGNLTVNGLITGKQYQVYQQSFLDDLGTIKHYLPWRDTDEQTYIYQEEAAMVAPADGRIVSVTIRCSTLEGSGNRTIGVHTIGPNTSQFTTGNWTEEETESLALSSTDDQHVFHFAFDNSKHFESGELVCLSIQDDADLSTSSRYTYVSTVVEWDYSTFLGGTSLETDVAI